MPCTASELIRIAEKEIGTTENPKGSNRVKYNKAYYSQDVSGDSYSWCAVFVWWCFRQAAAPELYYDGRKTAYVPTLDQWAKDNGLTVTDPQPGDLIIFDWNDNGIGDHIGICTGADIQTVKTIEGNTDDMVSRRIRQREDVLRVIRPRYAPESVSEHHCSSDSCPILAWLAKLLNEEDPS